MSKKEVEHYNHLKKELIRLGFDENERFIKKSHSYYWSRPDDEDSEDILFNIFIYFDKSGNFFTMELTNEHGHYADNPLPHIKSVSNIIDFWQSVTGEKLNNNNN